MLIDSWILDKIFQKVADKAWALTGISCYVIAQQCIILSIACAVIIAVMCSLFDRDQLLWSAVLVILMATIGFFAYIEATRAERRRASGSLVINDYRIKQVWSRMTSLLFWTFIWGPSLFVEIIGVLPRFQMFRELSMMAYTLYLYFMAVFPRPPVVQRERIPIGALPAAG